MVHTTFDAPLDPLHTEEAVYIAKAIHKRRLEFAAGRTCARAALEQWGLQNQKILRDDHGAPVWPSGMTGSISHSRDVAVCAVSRRHLVHSIGIDLEYRQRPFPKSILDAVFLPEELAYLQELDTSLRNVGAFALFSVKESIYKCLSNRIPALCFPDVRVTLDLPRGLFICEYLRPVLDSMLLPTIGRVGYDEKFVFSAVWCLVRG